MSAVCLPFHNKKPRRVTVLPEHYPQVTVKQPESLWKLYITELMEEAKKIKREKAKQNMSEGTGIYSAESGPL